MQQYFLSLIFGVITVSIFYMFGHVVLGNKSSKNSFTKLVFGIILFTTIYALVKSSFSSYMIIIPFLVFYIWLFHKKQIKPFWKINFLNRLKEIPLKDELFLVILPLYICAFLIFTSLYIPDLENNLHVIRDYSFYAAISETLNKTGIETKLFDLAITGEDHFVFYHYFELWLNAALTKAFGFTSLYTMVFMLIPILISILFTGVFEYLQDFYFFYKNKYWITLVLSISIVFLFPYTLSLRWIVSLGSDFHPWNTTIALPANATIKWTIVAIGLLYLIRSYKQNGLKNLPLIVGFIAVIYPTTMVVIIPSLFVWGFHMLYNKKLEVAKDTFWIIVILVLGMLLVLLNGVLPEIAKTEIGTLDYVLFYFKEDYSRLFIFIKEPLLRSAYILLAFSPILLLSGLNYKKNGVLIFFNNKKPLIVFFFIAYVLSLLGICLLDFSYDGDQIHSNIFYPLYILLFFFAFINLFSATPILKKIAISLYVVTIFLNIYGIIVYKQNYNKPKTENQKDIFNALNENDGKVVFINSEDTFKNDKKHPQATLPNPSLRFYVKAYFPTALSLDKIKIENLMERHYLEQAIKTSEYYDEIILQGLSYEEVIASDNEITFLIIDRKAPEYNDAEEVFNAVKIGSIGDFVYFKLKRE